MKVGDRVVLRAGTIVAVLGADLVRVRIDGDAPLNRLDDEQSTDFYASAIRYVLRERPPETAGQSADSDTLPMFPEMPR